MPDDTSPFNDLEEMRKDVDALGEALDMPPAHGLPKKKSGKPPSAAPAKGASAPKQPKVRAGRKPPRHDA